MKIEPTQYWISYGQTESSDALPLLMWEAKPSDKMVDKAYKKLLPYEYREVGFVNWSLDTLDKVSP